MKPATTLLAAALALSLAACGNDNTNDNPNDPNATAGTATTAPTDAGTMDGAADATAMAADDMAADGTQALAEGDRKALMAVEEVDRHEIAASEDAMAKNVEGDIRSYAETLKRDHTRNIEATRKLMGHGGADATGSSDAMAGAGATGGTAGAMGGTGTAGASPTTPTSPSTGMDHGGMDMAPSPDLVAMKDKHEAERKQLAALEGEAFTTAWVAAMVKGHEEALAKLDNELIPGATDPAVTSHLQTTRTAIAAHLETARGLQSGNR